LGDAKTKWLIPPSPFFKKLGIELDTHGKMPDVIIYDPKNKWLFLIEAVTSHGPFTQKRKIELERIFKNSVCGLIFVTAFPGREYKTSNTDLRKIAWETEVWFADEPKHMIHYNGHKFLGPYKQID
jgi:adenine-specific DNA-methyltransferase